MWFDITMAYSQRMDVGKRTTELVNIKLNVELGHLSFSFDEGTADFIKVFGNISKD